MNNVHDSGSPESWCQVSISCKAFCFLAVGLLYRQKTECHGAKKSSKRKKIKERNDTKMPDNENSGAKGKNMMYTQQLRHLPAGTIEQLTALLEKMAPKKYALIVHDKDVNEQGEPAEDHVHVMLSFENARHISSIAKKLGDKPQSIEMWKGKAENGYSYLIHATKDSVNKHQYLPSEVKANFNYQEEIRRITEEVERSRQTANSKILLDALYKGEISKVELEKN